MVLSRSFRALLTVAVVTGVARGENEVLTLSIVTATAGVESLRAGEADAWSMPAAPVHLNRTPPLYETDPRDDGSRPIAMVQLQKRDTVLYVRLEWTDSTADAPPSASTYADAGEAHIYKAHTGEIGAFSDAACVMIPAGESASGPLPSLVMGENAQPVLLYYWRNGVGFSEMTASGRGTTQSTGRTFPGNARYENNRWRVVFEVPVHAASTPLAFAIWDGNREHRDGLKFYSLWYDAQ